MTPVNRQEQLKTLFPDAPKYRVVQVIESFFQPLYGGWADVKNLPSDMRQTLVGCVPWISVAAVQILESAKQDTYKAALELFDGKRVETVLMKNRRGDWTICVSSQVGCAMQCTFCATGKMGLFRQLSTDEIVDQYRFWMYFLQERPELSARISNVVFMGMGEPLANYEAVREALNTWLAYTDLGPTHITVSTVGVLPRLEKILEDADWPHVRLAVSLHSADAKTRKEIVPTSYDQFLPKLEDWAKTYLQKFGNRRHHLTFEYVMLHEVNDTPEHARQLANFVNAIGHIKVNCIPYNFTDSGFSASPRERLEEFLLILNKAGVTGTSRRTMGEDIAAACGQLITEMKKDSLALLD